MDLKSLGSRHGEKMALGAAVLLFLAYFVYSAMFGGADPTQAGLMKLVSDIEGKLGTSEPPANPRLGFSKDVNDSWTKRLPMEPANNWIAYHPVKFEPKLVKVVVEGPHTLLAPKASEPSVDFGKLTLSWEPDDRSTAEVNGYEVARKGGPDKDWRLLTTEPIDAGSYDDQDVVPKITYTYRVRAVTEDKKAKARESDWSNEVSAMAMGVIELRLTMVGGDAAALQASVLIRKFVRGKWEEKNYFVKKGEKIGQVEKRREGNQVVAVDMSTGYTLVEIKQEKKKRTRIVPGYKEVDGVRVPDDKEIVEEIKEWQIIYKDEEGKLCEPLWRTDTAGGGSGSPPKKDEKKEKK
ncbi:MAG: fibronectin type III domain-containing protein [Planctomycetes bacterium]|nr:fibronectin type III domain-containing protein [Planctomycetota bacterium]